MSDHKRDERITFHNLGVSGHSPGKLQKSKSTWKTATFSEVFRNLGHQNVSSTVDDSEITQSATLLVRENPLKAILFLFFGLQIRRLFFRQIEIKIKYYFLGFFYCRQAKRRNNWHFSQQYRLIWYQNDENLIFCHLK